MIYTVVIIVRRQTHIFEHVLLVSTVLITGLDTTHELHEQFKGAQTLEDIMAIQYPFCNC